MLKNVTLDLAYIAICGCTREEYSKKVKSFFDRKIESSNEDLFEINAENSLKDMKMSKIL